MGPRATHVWTRITAYHCYMPPLISGVAVLYPCMLRIVWYMIYDTYDIQTWRSYSFIHMDASHTSSTGKHIRSQQSSQFQGGHPRLVLLIECPTTPCQYMTCTSCPICSALVRVWWSCRSIKFTGACSKCMYNHKAVKVYTKHCQQI